MLVPDSDGAQDLALGNLDGDGRDDIDFLRRQGTPPNTTWSFRRYLSGVQATSDAISIPISGGVSLGNVGGSELDDMVLVDDTARYQVRLNVGGGAFGSPINYESNGTTVFGARTRVIDLDGDGFKDVVMNQLLEHSIQVSFNDGAGGFFVGAPIYTIGSTTVNGIDPSNSVLGTSMAMDRWTSSPSIREVCGAVRSSTLIPSACSIIP